VTIDFESAKRVMNKSGERLGLTTERWKNENVVYNITIPIHYRN